VSLCNCNNATTTKWLPASSTNAFFQKQKKGRTCNFQKKIICMFCICKAHIDKQKHRSTQSCKGRGSARVRVCSEKNTERISLAPDGFGRAKKIDNQNIMTEHCMSDALSIFTEKKSKNTKKRQRHPQRKNVLLFFRLRGETHIYEINLAWSALNMGVQPVFS
jgi:hypothetical protein